MITMGLEWVVLIKVLHLFPCIDPTVGFVFDSVVYKILKVKNFDYC